MERENKKVVPIGISAKERAGNKLSAIQTGEAFMALLDALLDIRPRRTKPHAREAIITPEGDVIVVRGTSEVTPLGSFEVLSRNLDGIATMAGLDAEELAAVYMAVEEAKITEEDLQLT